MAFGLMLAMLLCDQVAGNLTTLTRFSTLVTLFLSANPSLLKASIAMIVIIVVEILLFARVIILFHINTLQLVFHGGKTFFVVIKTYIIDPATVYLISIFITTCQWIWSWKSIAFYYLEPLCFSYLAIIGIVDAHRNWRAFLCAGVFLVSILNSIAKNHPIWWIRKFKGTWRHRLLFWGYTGIFRAFSSQFKGWMIEIDAAWLFCAAILIPDWPEIMVYTRDRLFVVSGDDMV